MDQSPIFSNAPTTEPQKTPTRHFAGFWRRLFAFLIDIILISIPSFLLGYLFYDFFSRSSVWAAAIGLVITLPYFAIMGNSIGGGQTLGQRWAGVEIVDIQGNHVPLGKSVVRYTILLLSLGFGSALLPSFMAWPVGIALIATLYLYLFNLGTRQTLHDLATGSLVVEAPGLGVVQDRRPWPGHWVILVALGILGFAVTPLLTRTGPFPELLAVQRALLDSGEFRDVGVTLQNFRSGGRTSLRLAVTCKNKPQDFENTAKKIVTIAERVDPHASELGSISVDFKEGFSIGLAKYSATKSVSHTPQEWEETGRNN